MAILHKDIGLWEDRWNEKALRKKCLEIGTREFARGWRQQALSADEMLFNEEWLEASIDPTTSLSFPGEPAPPIPSTYGVYMGVDLAIAGGKDSGDYFVITVIAIDSKKFNRQLIGMCRTRGISFNDQIETIELWSNHFNPSLIFVESNAYQEAIIQELHRRTPLPVRSFKTTSVNKTDIENGLPRMSVEFEQSRWKLPSKGEASYDLTNLLVSEMRSYPIGKHDDCLMSLWFARSAATNIEIRTPKRIKII